MNGLTGVGITCRHFPQSPRTPHRQGIRIDRTSLDTRSLITHSSRFSTIQNHPNPPTMNPDETKMELQDRDAEQTGPDADQVPPDADATEADVSEADLDQEEQEKQPMTGGEQRAADGAAAADGAEKNGAVKLKIPEDEEDQVEFTGLNKEELLRVAGTPG